METIAAVAQASMSLPDLVPAFSPVVGEVFGKGYNLAACRVVLRHLLFQDAMQWALDVGAQRGAQDSPDPICAFSWLRSSFSLPAGLASTWPGEPA